MKIALTLGKSASQDLAQFRKRPTYIWGSHFLILPLPHFPINILQFIRSAFLWISLSPVTPFSQYPNTIFSHNARNQITPFTHATLPPLPQGPFAPFAHYKFNRKNIPHFPLSFTHYHITPLPQYPITPKSYYTIPPIFNSSKKPFSN